jgi:hypothetical protein
MTIVSIGQGRPRVVLCEHQWCAWEHPVWARRGKRRVSWREAYVEHVRERHRKGQWLG